jgi:outer membrane protein assembly factor BamB
MAGYCPSRQGLVPQVFAGTPYLAAALWAGAEIQSPPVVAADGTVYVSVVSGQLRAVAPDGTIRWQYARNGTEVFAAAAVATDGTIVTSGMRASDSTHWVLGLSPDGVLLWQYPVYADTDFALVSGPRVVAGRNGTTNAKTTLLNPASGVIWATGIVGRPVVDPGETRVYLKSAGLDLATGKATWAFGSYTSPKFWAQVVGPDGTVYGSTESSGIQAVDAQAQSKWVALESRGVLATAVLPDGGIVVTAGDNRVYVVEAADGTIRWNYRASNTLTKPIVTADGTILVGTADALLQGIASDGTPRFTALAYGPLDDLALGPNGSIIGVYRKTGSIYRFEKTP